MFLPHLNFLKKILIITEQTFDLLLTDLLTLCSFNVSAFEVACDTLENYDWSIGTKKTCFIRSTAIPAVGFEISSKIDESVGGIDLQDNTGVKFLPENVAKKFPKLIIYNAAFCWIQEVSKENFKNLLRLQKLYLNNNQIKKISINTFEDLTELEVLYLSENFNFKRISITE
jgi:Leucine-rich repeat (LRR) protein